MAVITLSEHLFIVAAHVTHVLPLPSNINATLPPANRLARIVSLGQHTTDIVLPELPAFLAEMARRNYELTPLTNHQGATVHLAQQHVVAVKFQREGDTGHRYWFIYLACGLHVKVPPEHKPQLSSLGFSLNGTETRN